MRSQPPRRVSICNTPSPMRSAMPRLLRVEEVQATVAVACDVRARRPVVHAGVVGDEAVPDRSWDSRRAASMHEAPVPDQNVALLRVERAHLCSALFDLA